MDLHQNPADKIFRNKLFFVSLKRSKCLRICSDESHQLFWVQSTLPTKHVTLSFYCGQIVVFYNLIFQTILIKISLVYHKTLKCESEEEFSSNTMRWFLSFVLFTDYSSISLLQQNDVSLSKGRKTIKFTCIQAK